MFARRDQNNTARTSQQAAPRLRKQHNTNKAKIAKSRIKAKKSCNLIKSIWIFSDFASELRIFSNGSDCFLTKNVKIVTCVANNQPIKNVTEGSFISEL